MSALFTPHHSVPSRSQRPISRLATTIAWAGLIGVGVTLIAVPAHAAPTAAISPDTGSADGGTEVTVTGPDAVVFTDVYAGGNFALAQTSEGELYGWGRNNDGQLARGPGSSGATEYTPVPVSLPEAVTYTSISTGYDHSLALGSDGHVYAWGNRSSGRLGSGSLSEQPHVPVQVSTPAGVSFTEVSAGRNFSLALDAAGQAYAWGDRDRGRLGDGNSSGSQWTPTEVSMPAGVTFTSISAGSNHSLALGSDGNVYAWGNNNYYQIGDSTVGFRALPGVVPMPAGVPVAAVFAGDGVSFALDTNGNAYAWGAGGSGELGNGGTGVTRVAEPVAVTMPPGVTFEALHPGAAHVLATGSDGNVYAWGYGSSGQLGHDSSFDNQYEPVPVTLPSGVMLDKVDAGRWMSLGVDDQGRVLTWGDNFSGQLGDGEATPDRAEPTAIAGQAPHLTEVVFGALPGTGLTFDAGTSTWVVTSPAHAAGTVDVVIEWELFGQAQEPVIIPSGFTYLAPATVPGPPTGVSGTPGDGSVVLEWDAPSDDGGSPITDYLIEYSADGGATWETFDDGESATPGVTVTGLTNGVGYIFRVSAVNAQGPSEPTASTDVVTPTLDEQEDPADPTAPGAPSAPDTPGETDTGSELPATGADSGELALSAALLLLVGAALVVASRCKVSTR